MKAVDLSHLATLAAGQVVQALGADAIARLCVDGQEVSDPAASQAAYLENLNAAHKGLGAAVDWTVEQGARIAAELKPFALQLKQLVSELAKSQKPREQSKDKLDKGPASKGWMAELGQTKWVKELKAVALSDVENVAQEKIVEVVLKDGRELRVSILAQDVRLTANLRRLSLVAGVLGFVPVFGGLAPALLAGALAIASRVAPGEDKKALRATATKQLTLALLKHVPGGNVLLAAAVGAIASTVAKAGAPAPTISQMTSLGSAAKPTKRKAPSV